MNETVAGRVAQGHFTAQLRDPGTLYICAIFFPPSTCSTLQMEAAGGTSQNTAIFIVIAVGTWAHTAVPNLIGTSITFWEKEVENEMTSPSWVKLCYQCKKCKHILQRSTGMFQLRSIRFLTFHCFSRSVLTNKIRCLKSQLHCRVTAWSYMSVTGPQLDETVSWRLLRNLISRWHAFWERS